jgi:hypothetical protein
MVSEATVNKYTNELLALYVDLYSQKYGKAPMMNRFKQKWGFRGMYEDLGQAQAKKVINHYFNTGRVGHPIDYLLYNYEKLNQILIELEQDARKREELRKETEQRVREWEARGNE